MEQAIKKMISELWLKWTGKKKKIEMCYVIFVLRIN